MDQHEEIAQEHNKMRCIHCRTAIVCNDVPVSMDHIPSRCLLEKPYPDNLASTEICKKCNHSFSQDEEYFAILIAAMINETADSENKVSKSIQKTLASNKNILDEIESAKTIEYMGGHTVVCWNPDLRRVENVVVKNARGHVYFQHSKPVFHSPEFVRVQPLHTMSQIQQAEFLYSDTDNVWPEVGTRMLHRMAENFANFKPSCDKNDWFWIVAQKSIYRYAINVVGKIRVRILIREFLAADIVWGHEDTAPLLSWKPAHHE